ncbi:Protein of unknown function [Paenibacillus sophorae]|uniref:DUF2975 domain-containing protein n=1 Tax=Paenibacillus sophorae TaxID=1333845 RepID=A0A1H8Q9G3_9BACL|nr:DUF2975 domain-containing protein [Paenibacillus sophorae]QWU15223.1 DUF2975 domain-containing protein [Paenibacillus sophorae]SEO50611.1 Protein of unknown function [Paenibacillus sophorae]
MERGTTLFLKATVCLIAIPILALCIFWLPWIAKEAAEHYPAYMLYPVLIGMYAAAIPFFFALYQSFRLLSYIDNNIAFSELSVRALKNIKYCAITISILYGACLPFLFVMAQEDDAPGLAALGLVIIFASFVIAIFAAVLQKLLKNAIDIKSENDLTV